MSSFLKTHKLPGSRFIIPSLGYFYKDSDVLKETLTDSEITISPMSAYDEIELMNIDSIISGQAVDNVFSKNIAEIAKPKELLYNDVLTILAYLRYMTYGDEFKFNSQHNCDGASVQELNILLSEHFKNKVKLLDPTTVSILSYDIREFVVKLRPAKYIDKILLLSRHKEYLNNNLKGLEFIIDSCLICIDKICSRDGLETEYDKTAIKEFLSSGISANELYKLFLHTESVSNLFGIDLSVKVKCTKCEQEYVDFLPIDLTSFFIN